MIDASQAFREYVFAGRDSSIAFSQEPSRLGSRGWIVIAGQVRGRQVRLAVTRDDLPEVWQALAGTGVAQLPLLDAAGIRCQ
jgi:hypothetical protein